MLENALKRILRSRDKGGSKKGIVGTKMKSINSMVNQKMNAMKRMVDIRMKWMKRQVGSSRGQREYKSYRRIVGKRHFSGTPLIETVDKYQIVDSKNHFAGKVEENTTRDELEDRLRQLGKDSFERKQ